MVFSIAFLQPIGSEHLVAPIWEVMDLPLGNTNFGDYLRISRNKLTTHIAPTVTFDVSKIKI